MDPRRYAMMFAHPAHELPALGLLQRYSPHLLFLTCADSAGDQRREAFAQHGLEQLGLSERASFLGTSEQDIYRWLLDGEFEPFLELRTRLLQWLYATRPNMLFGDAFELSNSVHDVGRVLLDSAWREYRQRFPCDNFELPLVCRTGPGLWNLRFQEFPDGNFETLHLTETETQRKAAIMDWVGSKFGKVEATLAAMVRRRLSLEREVFRQVSPDRDYTKPPEGLRLHYEEWGRFQVKVGRYSKPILFFEHFVPLVQRLPWLQTLDGRSSPQEHRPGTDREADSLSLQPSAAGMARAEPDAADACG